MWCYSVKLSCECQLIKGLADCGLRSEAGTIFSLLHVTIIICLPLTTEKSESNLGLSNIATVKNLFFFCNQTESKHEKINNMYNEYTIHFLGALAYLRILD